MSDEAKIQLFLDKLPTGRELSGQLDRVAMPADAKVLMGKLLVATAEVGGTIIEVGRRVVAFILAMVNRFPNTAFGLIVGVVITVLIGMSAVVGGFLATFLGPLLTAFMVSQGAIADMKNSSIEQQAQLFAAKLDAILSRG